MDGPAISGSHQMYQVIPTSGTGRADGESHSEIGGGARRNLDRYRVSPPPTPHPFQTNRLLFLPFLAFFCTTSDFDGTEDWNLQSLFPFGIEILCKLLLWWDDSSFWDCLVHLFATDRDNGFERGCFCLLE
ncbi:hypothetical protein CEXT_452421 [Caerostris extrusa]|uniref:Uncharacterized protein n=1 Tax=Caerostris extrusa TaxID=172846 RepID=A0AAV4TFT7_CAEEX|nr:hypothetical protein CEXT_452421 [Caerostris extrusa]